MIAFYARVSLEEQVEQYGLASQLHALREHAKAKALVVAAEQVIVDEGYGGADLDRPGLERLRAAIRQRRITLVLVHDPDRLTRRLAHLAILQEEAEQYGCRYEFVTTPAEPTPEGRMFLSLKGVFAEYEREKIKERTLRGRKAKAREGLIVGGICPYGYDHHGKAAGDRGHFTINDDQAAVVRQIFAWAQQGASIRDIAFRLTAEGIRPKKGGRWGRSSVARILTNETYVGRAYYYRRQRTAPTNPAPEHAHRRNKKTCLRERPRNDWIPITVPAIITEDVFRTVQDRLRANKALLAGRPATRTYLLKGLLRCAACTRRWAGNPNHGARFYRCTGHDRNRPDPCTAGMISADRIETAVWTCITEILQDPKRLTSLIATHLDAFTPAKTTEHDIQELSRNLDRLQRREERARQALLDPDLTPHYATVKATLAQATSDRQQAQERLQRLQATRPSPEDLQARIASLCARVTKALQHAPVAARQRFLQDLITKIIIAADHATIHCALPDEYRPQHLTDVDSTQQQDGYCAQRADAGAAGLRQEHARQTLRRNSAAPHVRGGDRNHQDPQHRRRSCGRPWTPPRTAIPLAAPYHFRRRADRRRRRHAASRRSQPRAQRRALSR